LEEDVTDLGRDPRNHIALADVQVSGFHARIERGPDSSFLLQDRQSTNGTFVNDEQVAGPRRLEENDALRVGNTTLVLKTVS
ncbi:MAG: FHA domain-containing protein, partial [Dehalococcoidia bacterium]